MRQILATATLVWVAQWLPSAARADAPLTTEDADVLAPGECEWEGIHARVRLGGASERGWFAGLQCRALGTTQVGLGLARSHAGGERETAWSLSGKTGLLMREGDGLGLVLSWGVDALRSPGANRYRHEGSTAVLVGTYGQGDWLWHGNLGWRHSQLDQTVVRRWALGTEYAVGDVLSLLAEVYGAQGMKNSIAMGARADIDGWSFGLVLGQDRAQPRTRTLTLSVHYVH